MTQLRPFFHFLAGSALVVSLAGCGLFGSNDDAPSLNGDLSWRLEADEEVELTVTMYGDSYDGSSVDSDHLGSYGLTDGSASDDLEDGDYEAYRLSASPFAGGATPPSVTLQLLSDGEVLAETSEAQDGSWEIKVGEFPDDYEK